MTTPDNPIEGAKPHEARLCGAKNRRGMPCRRLPTRGATRCKFHGGLTPIGPASPHWRHGRYSKIFSRIGLGAAYERALRDPRLGSVREQLAVCEARLEELFSRLTAAAARRSTVAVEPNSAAHAGNSPGTAARVTLVVERDPDDERIWQEAYEVMDLRRRLTETEARYLQRSGQTLTAEQAMALFGTVTQLVRKYVTDQGALTQLAHELRLLSRTSAADLRPVRD